MANYEEPFHRPRKGEPTRLSECVPPGVAERIQKLKKAGSATTNFLGSPYRPVRQAISMGEGSAKPPGGWGVVRPSNSKRDRRQEK